MSENKSKPTIAIDIDDVLADSAQGFIGFSNDKWGTTLNPSDYDEHLSRMWQVDHTEAERRVNEFYESGIVSTYSHNLNAGDVLKKLKEKYHLIIITARRIQSRKDTMDWINAKYPDIFDDGHIHFAGIWDSAIDEHSNVRTKGELSKSLEVDYIIDDQLKHCLAAAEFGIEALLFGNYNWNQADSLPSNIHRVSDWSEVLSFFEKKQAENGR